MKTNRAGLIVAALLVALTLIVFITLKAKHEESGGNLRATSILMLEGPFKSYAENEKAGIDLAVNDIQKKEGARLDVLYKSFDGDPQKALEALRTSVIRDDRRFVLEVFGTSAALAAADFANSNKVVLTSGVNTGYLLTQRMGHYCFRIIPSDGEAVQALLKWSAELRSDQTGIVSVTTDWGKGMEDMLAYYAPRYGIRIAARERVDKSHTVFEPQVLALKSAGVQTVFLAINPDQAANFIRAAKDVDFRPTFLGTDNLTSGEFTTGAGEAAEGVRYVLPPISAETPTRSDVVRRLREKLNLPPNEDPHPFALYGYDLAWITYYAIKASGGDPQRAVPFLENYNGVGITGPIRFTKNHDLVLAGSYRRMRITKSRETGRLESTPES